MMSSHDGQAAIGGEAGPADSGLTGSGQVIAEIWQDLFGLTEIAVGDDFFGLGGNSLTAIKFLARIEERFGSEVLMPETLYEDARLASLASAIDQVVAGAPPPA